MNDTEAHSLDLLLLAFDIGPPLPVVNKTLPEQKESMAALSIARAEMAPVTAELQIDQAIRSKLPPSTHFYFHPIDSVRILKEIGKRWCAPV